VSAEGSAKALRWMRMQCTKKAGRSKILKGLLTPNIRDFGRKKKHGRCGDSLF
jgi:hypothetical protein